MYFPTGDKNLDIGRGRSECRACGNPIQFAPHPQNPDRLAPFDADGALHFGRCTKRSKAKKSYSSADEILCATCEALPMLVYPKQTKGGERLAILCMQGHSRQIPMTPENYRLVNGTHEQAEMLLEFCQLRWEHSYSRDSQAVRRRARVLMRTYRDEFGVNDDLREFTGAERGESPWWYAQ